MKPTDSKRREGLAAATAVLWMSCLIVCAALLTTTGREAPVVEPDPHAPLAPEPAASPAPPEPTGVDSPVILVAQRDPFQPPGVVTGPTVTPPPPPLDCDLDGGMLTDIELASLKLEAVAMMERASARALVAGPAGDSVILREGDLLGKECARLVRIEEDEICLQVSDERSGFLVKLRLHPEERVDWFEA